VKETTGKILMSEKKVVSRKIVLAMVVLFILLLIVLSDVLQSQNATVQSLVSSKNSTIDTLNSEISSLKAESATLQGQVSTENASITSIDDQLKTEKSESAVQSASDQSSLSAAEAAESKDESQVISLTSQVAVLQNQISSLTQNYFSIVQISDTQYLSEALPSLYDGLTSWIASNSQALNLSMVVHTGDIVNDANVSAEWVNANAAMMTLYNDGVPYCWDAGNHDQIGTDGVSDGNVNGTYIGGNYPAFNVTIMRQEPYWVGDIFSGASTAVKFSFGNYRFMVVNVEYDANQTVLNWMESLLAANPNVNVIVATHNFLNGAGTYGTLAAYDVTWATNFEKILNNYPNVFMTLNGHDYGEGGTADNLRVGNREEVFFNRQEVDNQMGAATARIYTFDMSSPSSCVVTVSTYQTYNTPQYIDDPSDEFSFSTSLAAYSPTNASIPMGTSFRGASGYSVSLGAAATLQSFSQYGDALTFNGLTMNGAVSNFTVTSVGANIVINSFNATQIAYTVSGGGGSQAFTVKTAPTSVEIDGAVVASGDGWNYLNGEVTVTGATASVTINLT
jgi:hypothetical protein